MLTTRSEIQEFIDRLNGRGVRLYHACQLQDFRSYLRLGGIPSRALLESSHAAFTPFETDRTDQENAVWDLVFVNLTDFGRGFARGWNAVPNPYGPILIVMRADALLSATDVAVALRSAGSSGFDRARESLPTVDEIERVFRHPVGHANQHEIKFGRQLVEEFADHRAKNVEMSCTVPGSVLPFESTIIVYVDSVRTHAGPLRDVARADANAAGLDAPVDARITELVPDRRRALNEFAGAGGVDLQEFRNVSPDDAEWVDGLRDHSLEWQFERFCRYLKEGTLDPA